mgnify:CR=1 FL=1
MKLIFNKLLYEIDKFISKGTINIIIVLIIVIFLFSAIFSGLAIILDVNNNNVFIKTFSDLIFTSIKYKSTKTEYLAYESINFLMFTAGLFLTAALIGAITAGINDRLKTLRNSSAFIYEKNHTIILGFSSHVVSLVKELIIANESERNSCIVILGKQSRNEMRNLLKKSISNFKGTEIIFREGDRCIKNDLVQLNLDNAKSIIINQHSDNNNDVSKTLLAILNREDRKKEQYHIVAVVSSKEESILCKLIGKNEVEIIESNDFLARLEAQTCRQSGLPLVYEELLNFDGDEIYFKTEESLVGKCFSEAYNNFDTSTLIGIQRKNKVLLNPPSDEVIKKNDDVIGIASDDSTFNLDNPNPPKFNSKKSVRKIINSELPEKFLFLGFNNHTEQVLNLLGKYTNKNSSCDLVIEDNKKNKSKTFNNLLVNYNYTKLIDRSFLNKINFNLYNYVIVQSSFNQDININEDLIDNKSLGIILNLRDLKNTHDYTFKIISELFDTNNHELIQNSQVDDFILSEKFISSAIAQISENKKLAMVFSELFRPQGSEIYLKPINNYVDIDKEVDFFEVSNNAFQKKEIAIGYKIESLSNIAKMKHNTKEMNYGVVINPIKSKKIKFEIRDFLIVLSED